MSLSFANIGLIVSARCDSTRLPGKVMRRLNNKPMINFLLDRLAPTKEVQKIILATTTKKVMINFQKSLKIMDSKF